MNIVYYLGAFLPRKFIRTLENRFWSKTRCILSLTFSIVRTLWGEHGQAAFILATEERMIYQTLLSVSEATIVVGSLWWHIFGTSLAGSIA